MNAQRPDHGSASIWALLIIAGAFTVLLGLVVDGGRLVDARLASARAAGQAARTAADALSGASVRSGHDYVAATQARQRGSDYLRAAGMHGTVSVHGATVRVTVNGTSRTGILSVIGIGSLPIHESATATAITEDTP